MPDEKASPDYVKGSPEDEREAATTGKQELTPTDEELPEDQATLQTDTD